MSGGHLCEAEAPTEPTGETTPPYVVIREGTEAIPYKILKFQCVEDAAPYESVIVIL